MLLQTIKSSFSRLASRKLRTFLTMLGMIIGISSVIIIMSIGASAQDLILNQIRSVGSDLIGVLPGASDENGPPATALGITVTTLKFEDAEALAKKESQDPRAGEGGLMGMVEKGDMIENIDQVIFSLSEGSISDVLETEEGYHIFKVGAKTPASQKTFEEAKEEIREKLFRKKAHERFVSWMDELKKKAYISIR